MPIVVGQANGGHYINNEINKYKEKKGVNTIDLEDSEIKFIYNEGDRIENIKRSEIANISVVIIGVVLCLAGFLYKKFSYLDMFIISLPVILSFVWGMAHPLSFVVAMALCFGSIYFRKKLGNRNEIQTQMP